LDEYQPQQAAEQTGKTCNQSTAETTHTDVYGDKKNTDENMDRIVKVGIYIHVYTAVLPVAASLGQLFGNSFRCWRGTTTPSMFPNMEDSPRQKSMMKKRTAHSGAKGILVIASVNTMKARPVPSTPLDKRWDVIGSGNRSGLGSWLRVKMRCYQVWYQVRVRVGVKGEDEMVGQVSLDLTIRNLERVLPH